MNRYSGNMRGIRNLMLAITTTGFSVLASAQSTLKHISKPEIAVKYLGSQEDMILVGVSYESVDSARFSLSIFNEDSEVLFRNTYQATSLNKQFKVPKNNGKITFIFSGSKGSASKTFVVYNNSRVVEDLVVRKLN